jgi:hypothetical protein
MVTCPVVRLRRIWSETVPYAVLREPRVTGLLRRYGLGVLLAVRPPTIDELPRTVRALEGEGIDVSLWPMLDDADGRWANARNAGPFTAFARKVAGRVGPRELVVDLEPHIEDVRTAIATLRGAGRMLAQTEELEAARATYEALVRELEERGFGASAVVVPMVLMDRWEAILGTPASGPAWRRVNVMLYTSILEGWSRGLLDRADAVSVLAGVCRAGAARYGDRAAVSLGAVGTGAFGDEPVYRTPAELARDVAVARGAGIEDLALFDLGGVLARAPYEAWLEAFVGSEPVEPAPPETLRSKAAFSLAGATNMLAALLLRVHAIRS